MAMAGQKRECGGRGEVECCWVGDMEGELTKVIRASL
jgi:hypothetical protein